MKRALIIGDTGGIGAALSKELRSQDVSVTGLSRGRDGFDFADPEGVDALLGNLSGPFDIILVATGALTSTRQTPEKSLRELSAAEMAQQFTLNTIGPALVMRHATRLMPRDRRAVFAALSARVGSIGDNRLGGWYSYRASKAALNQLVHSAAIELSRSHKQSICVALHPGTVATRFTAAFDAPNKLLPSESAACLLSVLQRLDVKETGGFFAWDGTPIEW